MKKNLKKNLEENKGAKKTFLNLSSKTILLLGISWGISIVSTTAFIGLLIFILLAGNNSTLTSKIQPVDTGKVLGTTVNNDVNSQVQSPQANPDPNPSPTQVSDNSEPLQLVNGENYKGNTNATIVLIEYSDFQCPFCARYAEVLQKIVQDYPEQVLLVFRHFPLQNIHPLAQKAAQASECAAEQGKFWEMHDKIFDNQKILSIDNLKTLAIELGLNTKQFNECFDSDKYSEKIQNDFTSGVSAGVNGTPATFFNSQLIKGAVTYEQLKAAIDRIVGQ